MEAYEAEKEALLADLQSGRLTKDEGKVVWADILRRQRESAGAGGTGSPSQGGETFWGGLAQGALIEAPSNLAALSAAVSQTPVSRARQQMLSGGGGLSPMDPNHPAFQQLTQMEAEQSAALQENVRSAGAGAYEWLMGHPPREVRSAGARIGRAAGEWGTEALMAAPLVAPLAQAAGASVPAAIAGSMAWGSAGGAVSEVARPLGEGPAFLAGMATDVLGGVTGGALLRGGRRLLLNDDAYELGARFFQGKVANREEALRILQDEVDGDLVGDLPTFQALIDSSPSISRLTLTLGGRVDDFVNRVTRLRQANTQAMDAWRIAGFGEPGAGLEVAIKHYDEMLAEGVARYRAAYKGVPKSIGGIPINKVQARLAMVLEDAGTSGAHRLPTEVVKAIQKPVKAGHQSVSLDDLVRWRRDLGQFIREANAGSHRVGGKAVGVKDATAVRWASQLSESIDETLEQVAREGHGEAVEALQRANRIFREHRANFPESKGDIPMLDRILGDGFDDPFTRFERFLNTAKRPSEDLARVMRLFEGNVEAQEGLRGLMAARIFGLDNKAVDLAGRSIQLSGVKDILRVARRYGRSIDTLFGEGATHQLQVSMDRARKMSSGVVGTSGHNVATGINAPSVMAAPEQVGLLRDVVTQNWGSLSMKLWFLAHGSLPKSQEIATKYVLEALTDPEKAIGLLQPLTPREFLRWKQRLPGAAARSAMGTIGTEQGGNQ